MRMKSQSCLFRFRSVLWEPVSFTSRCTPQSGRPRPEVALSVKLNESLKNPETPYCPPFPTPPPLPSLRKHGVLSTARAMMGEMEIHVHHSTTPRLPLPACRQMRRTEFHSSLSYLVPRHLLLSSSHSSQSLDSLFFPSARDWRLAGPLLSLS